MYELIDCPANGAVGQHCGTFALAELPERIRQAVLADPEAGEWRLPALSQGDQGDPCEGLTTIVRRI